MSTTRTAPSPRTQTVSIVAAGAGQNIIYTVVTTFMLLFLLQYADFTPAELAIATTIIAVTRIVDAIGDPIVGSLIDRTQTRWGKLRPFVLFSALPVALLTTLLFTVPENAVLYFGIIYVLWGFAYTFCDVPLWGLIGSAFPDPDRRNRTVGYVRAFGAVTLGLATLGLTPLAHAVSFADETTSAGWFRAVALVTVIGMGVYLLAFFNVRERDSAAAQQRLSFRQLFGALFRNGPLLLILLGSVLGFGRFIVQAGGAVFAVIAYDDESLFTLLGAGIILGLVVASFVAPLLMRRWSSRTLAIVCGLGGALVSVLMFVFGFANIVSVLIFIRAKRLPIRAPMPTSATPRTQFGRPPSTQPAPWRVLEAIIAPNIQLAGNLASRSKSESASEAATSSSSSTGEAIVVVSDGAAAGATPAIASTIGSAAVRMMTRMVCTTAMPGRSAPRSTARIVICDSAPGLPARNADVRSQPWTRCR